MIAAIELYLFPIRFDYHFLITCFLQYFVCFQSVSRVACEIIYITFA